MYARSQPIHVDSADPVVQRTFFGATRVRGADADSFVGWAGREGGRGGVLPDRLRAGMEEISGISMAGVKVHYNSPAPAQLGAVATTQGSEIHLAPGAEGHLPHEAWHIVQQAQDRVRPTLHLNGLPINDQPALEREANVMGAQATKISTLARGIAPNAAGLRTFSAEGPERCYDNYGGVVQRHTGYRFKTNKLVYDDGTGTKKSDIVGEEAEAFIDPSDPKVGTVTPKSSGVFHDMGLIQGHLINAQVGGPGIPQNFFPFTKSLNAQHSTNVEQPLKLEVLKLHSAQTSFPWTKRHLYYKVKIRPKTWTNFDSTVESDTEIDVTVNYMNDQHQLLSSLPAAQFTVTDSSSATHKSLDTALTAIGFGSKKPTSPSYVATGGATYSMGTPAASPPHPIGSYNLMMGTTWIGVVEP